MNHEFQKQFEYKNHIFTIIVYLNHEMDPKYGGEMQHKISIRNDTVPMTYAFEFVVPAAKLAGTIERITLTAKKWVDDQDVSATIKILENLDFIENKSAYKLFETFGGGFIVYVDESGKHGLIAAENDLGQKDWREANRICRECRDGGFDDWRLPSKDELDLLYQAHMKGIGGFVDGVYWSSSEYSATNAWCQHFTNGSQYSTNKNLNYYVRAVRSF